MRLLFVTITIILPIIGCSSQKYPKLDERNESEPLQTGESLIFANKQNITIDSPMLSSASSARFVYIFRCSIIQVNQNAFSTITNMTEFTFSQNSGVNMLPGNVFHINLHLENINLVRNNLTYLEEHTFATLLKLRYLDISMNKISQLPPNLFNASVMLTKFLMQRNELKEIPDGIFDNASQLKYIDLSFNKIKKVSAGLFKYNYQLEVVSLQGNKIKHLEYGIEHLNVKSFNLHSNPLDLENKKVIEILRFLHASSIKTGVHLPHHKQDIYIEHEQTSTSTNYLLIILISVTVLLSVLVGYLIYIVKFSRQNNCMRYNMRTLSKEDLVDEEPWIETEINGTVRTARENS